MPTKLPQRVVRLAVAVGLVSSIASVARAESIFSMQGVAGATPFYNAASQEWFMPGAPLTSTTAVTLTGGLWFISPIFPGSFEWTGNGLDQDLSADGLADASFLASGAGDVFRWYGDVYDSTFTPLTAPGTLLLEGTVSDFRFTESAVDSNFLDINNTGAVATFTPTGGYLLNNTDGMNVAGQYTLSISLNRVEQDTNPIDDFTGGFIRTAEQVQIGMTSVPEPSSLGLLLLSSLVAIRRRRS